MTKETEEIEVEGIGKVTITHSIRAKYISIRVRSGQVILVVPGKCRVCDALPFLEKKKEWIAGCLKKAEENRTADQPSIINEHTEYKTLTFTVHIERFKGRNFHSKLKDGRLAILCPENVEIGAENTQQLIRRIIERAMTAEAKRVLPGRLDYLAGRCGLKYAGVRIRKTHTRWGSCTQGSHISLNMFLMRLPQHLVDYVLIHELCHTVELNHSERFWTLVNSFTDNKSKELREELRNYRTCV